MLDHPRLFKAVILVGSGARPSAGVERRIARLTALKAELSRMIGECGHGRVGECRVIEVLSDHGLCVDDRH